MSHTRKFKRKQLPKPQRPTVEPYPFVQHVRDNVAAIEDAAARSRLPATPEWAVERIAAHFEEVVQTLAEVLQVSREQVAPLEQLALRLSRATGMPAAQTAQTLLVLADCGMSAEDILAKAQHAYPYARESAGEASESVREVTIYKGCSVGPTTVIDSMHEGLLTTMLRLGVL